MSKITIFGGSGFLGSYVADELTSRGHEVLVADIRPSKYLKKNWYAVIYSTSFFNNLLIVSFKFKEKEKND